jgi:quinol monooxygenase YgiN
LLNMTDSGMYCPTYCLEQLSMEIQMPQVTCPLTEDCELIELRQYTLHPGQRDVLIELFDREFVETQEAVGMRVIGQFRDLDDPNKLVWMRGFADMASRKQSLEAFYGGPVWAAHRSAANATMIDSDNVLLLRRAWSGSVSLGSSGVRAQGLSRLPQAGLLDATIFHLNEGMTQAAADLARDVMSRVLAEGGARALGWYVSEPAINTFPNLPVREGENVLVGFALFPDESSFASFSNSGKWRQEVQPALQPLLARSPESHRLTPTSRSALHA